MSFSLLDAYKSDSSDDEDVRASQINAISLPEQEGLDSGSGSGGSAAIPSLPVCADDNLKHGCDLTDQQVGGNEKPTPAMTSQVVLNSIIRSEAEDVIANVENSVQTLKEKPESNSRKTDTSLNENEPNTKPSAFAHDAKSITSKHSVLPSKTNSHGLKRKHTVTNRRPPSRSDLPADFIAELQREGHDLSSVEFVDVDMRATTSAPMKTLPSSHVSQNIVHKTANRIVKASSVTRLERRRHQITALAAEAAALQVARQNMPSAVSRGRRGRRR